MHYAIDYSVSWILSKVFKYNSGGVEDDPTSTLKTLETMVTSSEEQLLLFYCLNFKYLVNN